MNRLEQAFASKFHELTTQSERLTWPSKRYEHNFVGFCEDILGLRLYKKQREFAELLQENPRVACKSGHKTGKSLLFGARAMHFYCTYEDARVFLMSPTDSQVKDPLWLEIGKLFHRSGTCLKCRDEGVTDPCIHSAKIDGDLLSHRAGLSSGMRSIKGFATRYANNISGKSGRLLWLLDEVPGIEDSCFEAVNGTCMGGAWMCLAGNPTSSSGAFFEAFHKQEHMYKTITMSCFDSPNVTGEMEVFGCATLESIKECEERWGGKDDSRYIQRILGNFAAKGRAQMLSAEEIEKAQILNEVLELDNSPLFVGIDVAGEGSDLWTFALRRGSKTIDILEYQFLTIEDGVMHLVQILNTYLHDGEVARIRYDSSGYYGNQFGIALSEYKKRFPEKLSIFPIVPSAADPSGRFDRLRDALLENIVSRIQRGQLGLPVNHELSEELIALERDFDRQDKSGKTKVKDKKKLRKVLGRSPDRCDALSYAYWNDEDVKQLTSFQVAERQKQSGISANPYNRARGYNPYRHNPQYPGRPNNQ